MYRDKVKQRYQKETNEVSHNPCSKVQHRNFGWMERATIVGQQQ
jgi:hypothetical protein